jgi:hypothetical protein
MNLQLTSDDGRAVDLLLDQAVTTRGNGNGQVYAVSDPSLGERVTRVSKLLHLLDAMPVFEPPDDLATRTLEYVQSADQRQPVAPVVPSLFGEQRPVA